MGGGLLGWLRRRRFWVGVPAVVAGGGAWAALADNKTGWTVVAASAAAAIGAFGPTVADRRSARQHRWRTVHDLESAELPSSVAWLLHPRVHVVPFVGRGWVLRELESWAGDPDGSAARLVSAAGGVGKTRLAWHFAGRLTGWDVRSVHPDAEPAMADLIASGEIPRRLLVIADYAEARDRAGLARLLCQAQLAPRTHRVRVLMLARDAGLWWETLSAAYPQQGHLVDALTVRSNVLELATRVEERSPREIVVEAVAAFAAHLGRPAVEVPERGWEADTPVLRLHAEALAMVLDGEYRSGRYDVLAEVLSHEARYWRGAARRAGLPDGGDPGSDAVLRQLAGLSAMLGPGTGDVAELVGRAPLMAGVDPPTRRRYAEWLRGLYPPDPAGAGDLGMVQPDLLAEALAVRVLRECTPAERTAVLAGAEPVQAVRALTTLGRACAHQADADALIGEVLATDVGVMTEAVIQVAVQFPGRFTPRMIDLVDRGELAWQRACALAESVPEPSLELGRLAAALTTRIVRALPPDTAPADRATWIHLHGHRLAEVGRRGDALTATRQAVDLRRELVTRDGPAHRRDLAISLNNYGLRLAEAGRRTDGLAPTREAVEIYRELAAGDRKQHLHHLAATVNNLALRLTDAERRAEALTTSQEAVDLFRLLVADDRNTNRPDLATALHNHAIRLAATGRREDALAASEEAVALFDELSAANQDAHLPGLALSLIEYAILLAESDRPGEAMAASLRAVGLLRRLAAAHPDAHLPVLASSLFHQALQLKGGGRLDDAVRVSQEAVDLYRRLTTAEPGPHRFEFARALHRHAIYLSDVGRHDDALAAGREAVALRRELAADDPLQVPDLARSLWDLGYVGLQSGAAPNDAVVAAAEGMRILSRLAAADPETYDQERDGVTVVLEALLRAADAAPKLPSPRDSPDSA